MLLEIGWFKKTRQKQKKKKRKEKKERKKEKKINQNCLKPGLSQFLFIQQKM